MEKEQHFEEEMQNADLFLLLFYNSSYVGQNLYSVALADSVLKLLNKRDFYKGSWADSDSSSIRSISSVIFEDGC
ncbi:MAG TPA: hypothetical protein ENH87_19855 [Pricia antarctica]|uniref:Uncharacterized protein n=1 Tax=Pricia antarctica TaxID=641691 RepID=A0A831VST3_9FLAO|nr:hypothetical protein [Pricia antarctica]